jgi:hypothetical protein
MVNGPEGPPRQPDAKGWDRIEWRACEEMVRQVAGQDLHGGSGGELAALSLDPPVKLRCEGCRIRVDALRPGMMGLV